MTQRADETETTPGEIVQFCTMNVRVQRRQCREARPLLMHSAAATSLHKHIHSAHDAIFQQMCK